ncbi:hypothetical protein A5634_09990 [Mycobacterium asiaticum]|uniref:Uncharacterized protein n=1 Tax=Mycobacterium asiaticum TaxID=1790 RepID=A0A1A3NID3_MYCAS|nr:hypothetical protein [Mycobacterium asiaticum]OBK21561.1 hypothetical protein A5634_09990 [Mycobacterium asiaticum]
MRTLLDFFLRYLDILYLDPDYRITNSETSGETVNASLTVSGPILVWLIVNDRGQIQWTVAPTLLQEPSNHFWISLIRQYLDRQVEITYLSTIEEVAWVRENKGRIQQLFSDESSVRAVCDDLRTLRRTNADKYWGPVAGDAPTKGE